MELFNVLNSYPFSFEVIVDRIVQLLNQSAEVDHDQIKVNDLSFIISID